MIEMMNCDCMDYMRGLRDKAFDLAIVDPPYRNQNENAPTKDMRNNRFVKGQGLGLKPSKKYFDEIKRTCKNWIIFGANNFQLPEWKGFIAWEKATISINFTMSMIELAAISEGLGTTSKLIRLAPQGTIADPRIHPTQKPVALYKWLLSRYAKPGDRILDTHGGSGSICIACHDLGFDLTWMELDKDYFDAACKRYKNHADQATLFDPRELNKASGNPDQVFDWD